MTVLTELANPGRSGAKLTRNETAALQFVSQMWVSSVLPNQTFILREVSWYQLRYLGGPEWILWVSLPPFLSSQHRTNELGNTSTPLRIFRQISHKIPGNPPEIELGEVSVSTAELCERVSQSNAATLGESNPFSLDPASAQKQAAALHAGKRITGHTALLKNEPLWAYAAGGIGDDHNAHRPEDVTERLRLGMMLTVMSGSMNSNIENVFSDIPLLKADIGHMCFCADDKVAEDSDSEGHIDHHVRKAIEQGVDKMKAYRMATLNPAVHYRIDHLVGSVTPGKLADLLIWII
jgi:adenine deaminase